jgi:hypothetical protein
MNLHIDKFISVGDLRDLEIQVSKGEISYSRMVEIINERALEWRKIPCYHNNITFIEEIPTDGKVRQPSKHYVICSDCKRELYTSLMTKEIREIPLYPNFNN